MTWSSQQYEHHPSPPVPLVGLFDDFPDAGGHGLRGVSHGLHIPAHLFRRLRHSIGLRGSQFSVLTHLLTCRHLIFGRSGNCRSVAADGFNRLSHSVRHLVNRGGNVTQFTTAVQLQFPAEILRRQMLQAFDAHVDGFCHAARIRTSASVRASAVSASSHAFFQSGGRIVG